MVLLEPLPESNYHQLNSTCPSRKLEEMQRIQNFHSCLYLYVYLIHTQWNFKFQNFRFSFGFPENPPNWAQHAMCTYRRKNLPFLLEKGVTITNPRVKIQEFTSFPIFFSQPPKKKQINCQTHKIEVPLWHCPHRAGPVQSSPRP